MTRRAILPLLLAAAFIVLPACASTPSTETKAPVIYVAATMTATALPSATATPQPTATPMPTPTAVPLQHVVPQTAPPPAPKPTPKPTPKPAPKPVPTPIPPHVCGNPCNPFGYNFIPGNLIYSPPGTFCNYFRCIPSFWDHTNGYVEQCSDGMFSHSGGVRGSCSYHGGNWRPLYSH